MINTSHAINYEDEDECIHNIEYTIGEEFTIISSPIPITPEIEDYIHQSAFDDGQDLTLAQI